jgi:hypothetical protein
MISQYRRYHETRRSRLIDRQALLPRQQNSTQ